MLIVITLVSLFAFAVTYYITFVSKSSDIKTQELQDELDDYYKRHDSTLKRVKRSILSYWEQENFDISRLMITDVEINIGFKESDDAIKVYITSGRPGLLIGKGGRSHKSLKSYIELDLEKKIELEIVDCKLWKNLYSF